MGRTDVGESGLDEDSPESEESSERALNPKILHKRSGIAPLRILASSLPNSKRTNENPVELEFGRQSGIQEKNDDSHTVGATACRKDHTEDNQAHNC